MLSLLYLPINQIALKLNVLYDVLFDSFSILCEGHGRNGLLQAEIGGAQTDDQMRERVAAKAILQDMCQL